MINFLSIYQIHQQASRMPLCLALILFVISAAGWHDVHAASAPCTEMMRNQ